MKIVGHSSGITKRSRTILDTNRVSHHATGTDGFIAIDGEGINLPNGEHRYVLLGVGNDQIENENGLDWKEILPFIYKHYRKGTAFVGFFLSYDFDRWLRTMPEYKVKRLVTTEGRAARKSLSPKLHNRVLPVDLGFWQINMLGKKMFEFRRRSCHCDILYCKCPGKGPWMRICDAGPFFQTSLLKAIDPAKWQDPIVTIEEYNEIKKGKENRPYATCIDDEMRYYNRLENDILVRLLKVLDSGFREMGIVLSPGQWFGPGQAAQKWMKKECVPKAEQIRTVAPDWFLNSAGMSYFGGWFEIMMHGIIPGKSHEYDINSAYPYIISNLPCLLHGDYERGSGKPPKNRRYTLVFASVSGYKERKLNSIGAMLHRESSHLILRPVKTKGWYWLFEIDAAVKAGLIEEYEVYEWMTYDPCDCLPPMRKVSDLYDLRIKVGKDTPLGKGCRLAYNSMYGKFAQSVGSPIFANPIYASLITAGCRTMILDAIATHPNGQYDVSMVATDAVFFCTPHPGLPISKKLGDWDYECRDNLTLFKPGIYWDDNTRRDISEERSPIFKARGIAAADFATKINEIDRLFMEWDAVAYPNESHSGIVDGWPFVEFESGFAMVSCLQAIRRNKWELAGHVTQTQTLKQNANPYEKRLGLFQDTLEDGRIVWRSMAWMKATEEISTPYVKRFGIDDPWSLENLEYYGITPDGLVGDILAERLGLR